MKSTQLIVNNNNNDDDYVGKKIRRNLETSWAKVLWMNKIFGVHTLYVYTFLHQIARIFSIRSVLYIMCILVCIYVNFYWMVEFMYVQYTHSNCCHPGHRKKHIRQRYIHSDLLPPKKEFNTLNAHASDPTPPITLTHSHTHT